MLEKILIKRLAIIPVKKNNNINKTKKITFLA